MRNIITLLPIKEGKYKGIRYFITEVDLGIRIGRNGYVEVPKNWDRKNDEYIPVHGGITFNGEIIISDGTTARVIGFDTFHFGDTPEEWTVSKVEKECFELVDMVKEILSKKTN